MATNSQQEPLNIRVVSYNVLSSHLASPSHFTKCHPSNLDAKARLPKILHKLDTEINNSTTTRPIICLQEVSHEWAGKLHTFFASRNYHFITGLYGRKFNGYMGVALAFPLDSYDAVDIELGRLSDSREGGWPRPPRDAGRGLVSLAVAKTAEAVSKSIALFVQPVRYLLRFPEEKAPVDHWEFSEYRHNMILFARLRERGDAGGGGGGGRTFCVSTYHMPCAFFAPKVMNIHCDLVARRTEQLANNDPFVLAGDFNIMPDSSMYRMLTTGVLDEDDPTYPTGKHGVRWEVSLRTPVKSAYAECSHGEPDYTNYAIIRDGEPFIGTLDYLFLSGGHEWSVKNVNEIGRREDANGPLPNDDEPSDHVLIAADLELP